MSQTPHYNAISASLEAELKQEEALVPSVPALPIPAHLGDLLPTPIIELSNVQLVQVERAQLARKILGPAGAAVLTCPDPENLAKCPHRAKCEYVAISMDKVPHGQLCPVEARYVADKFQDWLREFGTTAQTMSETDRITICELVALDLKELRCNNVLSEAENARLVENAPSGLGQGGEVCEWENMIHRNEQILVQVHSDRRMILKSFELTPEQKTKKRRWEGEKDKIDIASRQAHLAKSIAEQILKATSDDEDEQE